MVPFSIERRPDGVAVVRMDVPGESMNVLKAGFAADFTALFAQLATDASVRAVVFTSGKPESFIAGADVKMLDAVQTTEEAEAMVRAGHRAMDLIETFPKRVVAAIHGVCLGGGLEIALACHVRVASDDRKTRLGLPEVLLGLLPGAGGTQRLPRLIGPRHALELMLSGKHVEAFEAKKLGIVEHVVPPAELLETAVRIALAPPSEDQPTQAARMPFAEIRRQTLATTQGNYPAPEEIIRVVEVGVTEGFVAGLEVEAEAFGRVVQSPQAKQLLWLFRATTQHKKEKRGDPPAEYVTRISGALRDEAARLAAEGVLAPTIDAALLKWGFPAGAGGELRTPADVTTRDVSLAEIGERCALRMVNEAARCLDEKIVASARDADLGAISAAGFPRFRGGPLRHVDATGAAAIARKLESLREVHGDRFGPAPSLTEMAQTGARFYDA